MSTPINPGRPSSKYGKRDCPALNAIISPADCGARRGSQLACPAHCAFFPFAPPGYELWLKVDGAWTGKALDYVTQHWGAARFKELVKRCTIPMQNEQMQFDCALYNSLYPALFIQKRADGRTLVEQWESEQWTGLNNDERVMMKYRREGRPTVIEIQRVIDAQSVECRDALVPDAPPFLVLDRGVAAVATRFSRIFTWLFRYPHFARLGPNAVEVPHTIWDTWRARLEERHRQAAQSRPGLNLKEFLAEAVIEWTQLVFTLGDEYRDSLLANLDFHHCVASFQYRCPRADLEAILRSKPDFAPDDAGAGTGSDPSIASFTWLRRGESEAFEREPQQQGGPRLETTVVGVGTLGNVRLSDDHLVFEAFAKSKYAFGRQMIDRYFGALLQFEKEAIRDMATIMAEREQRDRALGAAERVAYGRGRSAGEAGHVHDEQPEPASGIPPEVRHQKLEEAHQQHYRRFLEDAIPALNGLTPRAAAADPETRPRLVEMMKNHIQAMERRNREDGLNLTLDWALEELGLRELL